MRRGTHDVGTFVSEDGVFQGISLGWDFTAEHEWGIAGIKHDYGLRDVSRKVNGIESRRIQRIPDFLQLIIKQDITYLISTRHFAADDKPTKKFIDGKMSAYGDGELQAAWDSGSFAFRVTGKENRKYLKELMIAFNNDDVIITFGNGDPANPFSRNGMLFLIASRLPQSYNDELVAVDTDRFDRYDMMEASGIEKKLRDAGLSWFALTPKMWANEEKTEVSYWLNPAEQHKYNSGWMSIADLEEWAEGKGKIVKVMA